MAQEPFVTVAVTLLDVSKIKPDGTFNIIVPKPIFPTDPSVIIGPVRAAYVPPTLSAEIDEPFVVVVIVAFAANTVLVQTKKVASTKEDDKYFFIIALIVATINLFVKSLNLLNL